MVGQGRKAVVAEPINGLGCLLDEHADQLWIDFAVADAHDVVKVRFGRILDALLGLESRPGGGNLSYGTIQRASQAVRPDPRPALARPAGRRKWRMAAPRIRRPQR